MVFLQNVMHLGHIFAADGLDDIALVIRGMETGPAPSLGLTVQRSAACQRVLQTDRAKAERTADGHIYHK